MDKYARQSHKTNQRARRRNNTAQYVLDNQLRQLDRDLRCGQIAYQRNFNRVKSELSNLEGISSDFELPLHDNPESTKTPHIDNERNRPRTYSGYMPSLINDIKRTVKSVNEVDDPTISRSLSSISSKDNSHNTSETDKYCSNARSRSPSTHFVHPIPRLQRGVSKIDIHRQSSCSATNQNLLTSREHNYSNCRFPGRCNHFPCKLPQTYHTLGFRREDLCPQNDDDDFDDGDELYTAILFQKPSDKIHNGPRGYSQNKNETINTRWIKNNDDTKKEFNPIARGPIFGYRPSDPVLERIRQHRKEPKLSAARQCARVTIRDRIRGVKQLVKEMRLSNEKIKPEDWATNYGKRVPTRVLLNPVVPV